MTTKEIIASLEHYLDNDRNFIEREDENDKTWSLITFDITNRPDSSFYAPYFKVSSVEEAKDIIRNVVLTIPKPILETKYKEVMEGKVIDESKDLFLAIYRPERRVKL